jgi:predicted RND superfamily exporter protein
MKALKLSIVLLFTFHFSLFAQQAPSVDSVKTDIIETDSTVVIKSTQVTSVEITSQRIAQELERYKYEETQVNTKLDQIRKQIKEFERLMGGVIVTEKRIADKIEKRNKDEETRRAKDSKPTDPPTDPKKKAASPDPSSPTKKN